MCVPKNYVTVGWDKIKKQLSCETDLYSCEETKSKLLNENYYKFLFGRAKNRTLIKQNPKLYKSILFHTYILENAFKQQQSYKGWYNFSYRIRFIVEHNYDLTKLKCHCGKKITWTKYCRRCPEYHKTQTVKLHTPEAKQKMRVSALKYLSEIKGQIIPRYNKKSIQLIDDFGNTHGYTFRHAENGGEFHVKELGYWLDAYDEKNNVVLEIYEKRHYKNGKLKQRDVQRENEIKNLLGCRLFTIDI